MTVALRVANRAIGRVIEIPLWVPTPANVRLRRALAALNSVVYEMIHQRRQSREDTGDLLSKLMHARDEETGEAMNDRQLRDEVMTIFLAGHEMTVVALGWTWDLLSRHPVVAQRLRRELADVLGGAPARLRRPASARLHGTGHQGVDASLSAGLDSSPDARSTPIGLADTKSLHGPSSSRVRTLPIGSPVCGPTPSDSIRVGSNAIVPGALAPFAYFPFGGGPGLCIGNTFAMMETILVVATIGQR